MKLLAGDIGGTKTVLGLFEQGPDGLTCVRETTYASAEHASLESIVEAFIHEGGESVAAACFGAAGPVMNGRCQATNLPWLIEESALGQAARGERVRLINDLEAAALGMLQLADDELLELNPGAAPPGAGNVAVIAAGTGLGEAIMYWDGQQHQPFATEGGHSDFAPNCSAEDGLLAYLRELHGGHVSVERVLSGPGLHSIYAYLRDSGFAPQSGALADALAEADPSAVISQWALERKDPLCTEALQMFVRIYGAEASNLALKCLATGGVLIGGGIGPKILPAMQNGTFMAGFLDKGRFRPLLQNISVKLALNSKAPLIGAAHAALDLIGQ